MIKKNYLQKNEGAALIIVILIIIMLTLIGGFMLNLGYNQRRLLASSSARHIRNYYAAQAGVVDANSRIRTNYTAGLTPAGDFTDPAYDPQPYMIDLNGDGIQDVSVDIGPVTDVTTGARQINSTGLDN